MAAVFSIDQIPRTELSGRRVMVRIEVQDDMTLQNSLSTVAYLSQAGARVIIAADTHLDEERSRLTQLLGRDVHKLREWKSERGRRAVDHLPLGGITFIEDLALEPGEQTADDRFAKELAHLCDIYCNDAFAMAHEIRASTVTVAKKAKFAVAGLVFKREFSLLEHILRGQDSTLSLLGGELSREKLLLAEEIARRSDHMLLAGQIQIPFLVAKGILPGDTAVSDEVRDIAERMLKHAQEEKRFISTPLDFTVIDRAAFDRLGRGERFVSLNLRNVTEDKLTTDDVICDIGIITRWNWIDLFAHVKRIFWHGPVGIPEIDVFCDGSRFLAWQFVSPSWPEVHRAVMCGQSLIAGLRRTGFPTHRIRYLSSSGRAALYYFAGRPLPAVEVLSKALEPRREEYHVLIPLTGSEKDACALHAAAENVARDARVFLLHVRSGIDEEEYPDFIAALTDAERLERHVESQRIFAEANRILASHGLFAAERFAAQGKPHVIISRYATRTGARLIVMAGGDNASVDASLIARCDIDFAADASGSHQLRLRRLLLPVDDSRHSLEAAARLSEFVDAENLEINLLYVQKEIEREYEAEKVFLTANTALARQGLISHRQFTAVGKPANEILRCAAEIGADLIVMGARTMSSLERMLLGSVSHRVSKEAECPVLIVRGAGEEIRKAA